MAKSKKNRKTSAWADRQNRDQFVRKAREQGLRARAAFKLEEIDAKHRLVKANSRVVDLGSAPGSWCQYLQRKVGENGLIFALDLLEMPDIPGVNFLQGDFTNQEVVEQLIAAMAGQRADLVLSDMAPNITGIASTDQARCEVIVESLLMFCHQALRPGGNLLFKLFEGTAANLARKALKTRFRTFQVIKPDASRAQSKEIFFLAKDFLGTDD